MSEAAELERAAGGARAAVERAGRGAGAALERDAPGLQGDVERLSAAGARSVAWLRRFEADPRSRRPPGGAPDELRDARHDVRSAAQTVLAQLDLIAIAWTGWDAGQRVEALTDLEAAEAEVGSAASLFLEAARRLRH